KKFKDRATAVSRIWKALQSLGNEAPADATNGPDGARTPEAVHETGDQLAMEATSLAPQTPGVAPQEPPAKTKATQARKAFKAAANADVPREGSKTSRVIAMLKQDGGATLEEISKTMEKIGDQRTYSIKA